MPKILPHDEIAESINSINSKQREIFNVVHTWVKNYVKYSRANVKPVHTFRLGIWGTGKSHLLKLMYNAISKTLVYYWKDTEKPSNLFLGPTGISAVKQYVWSWSWNQTWNKVTRFK